MSTQQIVDATVTKMVAVEHEMNQVVVDQPTLVHELLLAVLSRGHFLALGEAGIAKTFTVDIFMSHVTDIKKFYAMCFKAMDHQVLIGNLSPKQLIENDNLVYNIEGRFPDCHIGVLDEILKNNAVNLNMLLPILNERKFVTNGHTHDCPLWTCVGTSNLDEYHVTGELAAFSDRFGARLMVEPVSTDDGFRRVLEGQIERFSAGASLPTAQTIVSHDEIVLLQQAAQAVVHPNIVIEAVIDLRKRAEQEGLRPSARRFGQMFQRMSAQAVLNGRSETQISDITLAQHSLWTDLEDRSIAYELIVDFAGAAVSEANKLRKKLLEPLQVSLNELAQNAQSDPDADLNYKELARLNAEAKKMRELVTKALADATSTGEDTTELNAVQRELEQAVKTIREQLDLD